MVRCRIEVEGLGWDYVEPPPKWRCIRGHDAVCGQWRAALNNQRESRETLLGAARGLSWAAGLDSPLSLPCAAASHITYLLPDLNPRA